LQVNIDFQVILAEICCYNTPRMENFYIFVALSQDSRHIG